MAESLIEQIKKTHRAGFVNFKAGSGAGTNCTKVIHDGVVIWFRDADGPELTINPKSVGTGIEASPYLISSEPLTISGKVTDVDSGVASFNYSVNNGSSKNISMAADGSFTITTKIAIKTANKITFNATDNAGNVTTKSYYYGIDNAGVTPNASISASSSAPTYTHLSKYVITGKLVDSGDFVSGVESLKITDPNGKVYTPTINSDGSYSVEVDTYVGKKEYSFEVIDKLGNKASGKYYLEQVALSVTAKNGSATYNGNALDGGAGVTVSAKTGYTIYYGTSADNCTSETKPTHTDAGTYTVYYKVVTTEDVIKTGSYTITIAKANPTFTVTSSVDLKYGSSTTASIPITTDIANPEFEITNSNASVASATLEGNRLTIKWVSAGSTKITVKLKESSNYVTKSADINVTTTLGTIEYTANGYGGSYNGASHTGSVTVTTPGCTIKYGTVSGSYTLTSPPTFSSPGSYSVYFQITKANYVTVTGSFNVVLRSSNVSAMTIYNESGANPDIRSGSIGTTFSNGGYTCVLNVDGSASNMSGPTANISGVSFTRRIYANTAGQIVFEFDVVNTSSATRTIGIAVHSDVQIGSNDSAPIYPTSTGFYMSNGSAIFDVHTSGGGINIPADGAWFGRYSQRGSQTAFTGKSSALTGTDSGICINWHGRQLTPGSRQVFNFIMDMR